MPPKTRLQEKRPRVAASEAESVDTVEKTDKELKHKTKEESEKEVQGGKDGPRRRVPEKHKHKNKNKNKNKNKQKDNKYRKKTAKGKKEGGKSQKGMPLMGMKKRRKHPLHYSGYLFKVLKQVHPELGISKRGMNIMNSFMNDIFDRIATESSRLLRIMSRRTLSGREVQTSVRLLLPGELAKHAVSEGTKSVNKFFNQEEDKEGEEKPKKGDKAKVKGDKAKVKGANKRPGV